MLLKITKAHINRGVRNDPYKGPVGLALFEQTGIVWHVTLNCISAESMAKSISTPTALCHFIYIFNECGPAAVSPMEIELNLP